MKASTEPTRCRSCGDAHLAAGNLKEPTHDRELNDFVHMDGTVQTVHVVVLFRVVQERRRRACSPARCVATTEQVRLSDADGRVVAQAVGHCTRFHSGEGGCRGGESRGEYRIEGLGEGFRHYATTRGPEPEGRYYRRAQTSDMVQAGSTRLHSRW